ncbi:putative sodium-dependent multivitamin transporter [Trichonephila inaurata madagascariensis]|uniref:Putative sodium-dependent multivitamin transporter n=1 Tax=Trichonephila inaurata madagascariensis TaxID=2747483 RepID=A0A8X6X513_9ARAC|nr:putative sodium-dependent multivitamin transporter [Trichonephila inaurata madagascariensis]
MKNEKLILSVEDYVVIVAMLFVSTGIGLYFHLTSKKKTNEEYLLAGKDMSVLPVALSLMATLTSTSSVMGIPAEMYLYGTNLAFLNLGFAIGPIIAAYIFLPIFFVNDVSTAYEYLEKRFGTTARRLISAMFAFQSLLFTGAALYAPALALSAVTNLSMKMSVIVIGFVCTSYCTLGGMKAVLWADVFQTILMFAALFAIIIKGFMLLGSIGRIFEIANEGGRLVIPRFTLDPEAPYSMFSVFAQGMIITMSSYAGSQTQVQRLRTLKNLNKSKLAAFLSIPLLVSFNLLCCLCGLIIYAYFRFCDPLTSPDSPIASADQLLPYFITTTLSDFPGLPGLCICGIFSASLSTASSSINSLASVTSEDFLKPIFPSHNVTVFHNKIISLVFGVLCVGMSFLVASLGHLVKISIIILGLVNGPNLAVFFLAACTTRANEKGVILGILVSLVLSAYLSFSPKTKPYPFLPLSNECPSEAAESTSSTFSTLSYSSTSFYFNTTFSSTSRPETEDDSFHVSYMWISTLAFITCFIVAYFGSVIISCLGGKSSEVPDIYLSPIRTKFFKTQTNTEGQKYKYRAVKAEIKEKSVETGFSLTVSSPN